MKATRTDQRKRDARRVARRAAWLMFHNGPECIETMREEGLGALLRRDWIDVLVEVPNGDDPDSTDTIFRRIVLGVDIAEELVIKIDQACDEFDGGGQAVSYGEPERELAAEEAKAGQDQPNLAVPSPSGSRPLASGQSRGRKRKAAKKAQ